MAVSLLNAKMSKLTPNFCLNCKLAWIFFYFAVFVFGCDLRHNIVLFTSAIYFGFWHCANNNNNKQARQIMH